MFEIIRVYCDIYLHELRKPHQTSVRGYSIFEVTFVLERSQHHEGRLLPIRPWDSVPSFNATVIFRTTHIADSQEMVAIQHFNQSSSLKEIKRLTRLPFHLCVPFQFLNQEAHFHKTLHEYYTTEDYRNAILFYILSYSVYLSIYPSMDLQLLWAFLNLHTIGRARRTGDQTLARPLPTHRTTQTQNKRTQTSMPRVEL
jgi:hypothetical protein